MNFSKVKLVVFDMDGTLLNTKGEVSRQFFKLFNSLKKYPIHFVAASGRQYHSICNKLDLIKDEITIIAENGGFAKQQNNTLLTTKLPDEIINRTIPLVRNLADTHSVLCGKNKAYIETNDENFISLFKEYYNRYEIVEDLTQVKGDDFLKIALYHSKCSETYIYPVVKHFENEILVKVSGEHWVDLSHVDANKGHALKLIQEKFGISKKETIVFGDYNNDIEMLDQAYFSYAMENAHPDVKERARFKTKSNDNQGVEFILERLLNEKSKTTP